MKLCVMASYTKDRLSLKFLGGGGGGERASHFRNWVFTQRTLSVLCLHLQNLHGSKDDTLLGLVGMVSKVIVGK